MVRPRPATRIRRRAGGGRPAPEHERNWSAAEEARWLLHVPASLARRLDPVDLVRELAGRLRDMADAAAVVVEVDRGDGSGARELARAGVSPADSADAPGSVLDVPLPTTTGLHGTIRLVLREGADAARARELTELIAGRVAITAESQWLREVDQRRRAWTTYLVEASELLGQSLDLDLTVALVPQLVVPRLGTWCAVLLPEPSRRLRLAAIAHADEDRLPELRAVLDPDAVPGPPPQLRARLAAAHRGAAPSWFSDPEDGVAVALRAGGASTGVLLVGRPAGRPHTPEDLLLIDDIARRAALAVHNAQTVGEHVRVSQTLQAALLPRALPQVPQIDFAAEYLPASTGADVGGDFYDVVAVGPERWLVTIGDVCGKGARAAARTGLVRDVLRALVREGRPLVRAIEMLNDVMLEAADPQQFCTLAAVMLSRATARGAVRAHGGAGAGRARPTGRGPRRRHRRADRPVRHRAGSGRGRRPALHPAPARRRGDAAALHRRHHRVPAWPRAVRREPTARGGRRRVRPERRAARGDRARGRAALRAPTSSPTTWPCSPSVPSPSQRHYPDRTRRRPPRPTSATSAPKP